MVEPRRGFIAFNGYSSMKRNTPDHWKMSRLARILKIPLPHAVGLMEMLFHLTAKQAIHGNIGKIPDDIIAEKCGWLGDAAQFVEALVEARWLDRCKNERYVVHDWAEHCDDAVKKAVTRSGIEFYSPVQISADNGGQVPTDSGPQVESVCLPSLAMPSLISDSGEKTKVDHGYRPAAIGTPPQTMEQVAADLARDFWFNIPGTSKPHVPEFTTEFLAKLRWLEANGRDDTEHIRACISNPKRDKAAAKSIGTMFKFWQFCGIDGDKANGKQRTRAVTGGDEWGDRDRYDGRNVRVLDPTTGELCLPAAAG